MTLKDTSFQIEQKFRSMMMLKDPSERVIMGCNMFDTAKEIAISSIAGSELYDSVNFRIALFRRFYGHEFSKEYQDRFTAYLQNLE